MGRVALCAWDDSRARSSPLREECDVTSADAPPTSKNAARKAGSFIRATVRGDVEFDTEALAEASDTVTSYRSQFTGPTLRLAAELGGILDELGLDAELSYRIKRWQAILDKLTRDVDGVDDLSRMRDIGGCRVVLSGREEIYQLLEVLRVRWGTGLANPRDYQEIDYIQKPRSSGYRAIHVIVKREGYSIEVQLRDIGLHAWADDVEALSVATRVNYKKDGDSVVQTFMKLESRAMQLQETGSELPDDILESLDTLRTSVRQLVERQHRADGEHE